MYIEDNEYFNADGDVEDNRKLHQAITQLRKELTYYRARDTRDMLLREGNAGLKELYDQYQTMLKLLDK